MTLRLPEEKLRKLRALLTDWHGRKSGLRGELESLVGQLQHASKVVRPGRSFLRRLYDLLPQTSHFQKHFRVRLSAECQADIEWWFAFGSCWNGVSILRHAKTPQADIHYILRCFGLLGLRHLMGQPMVPSTMARPSHQLSKHRPKGAIPHFGGISSVGRLLEGSHRLRPL